MELFKIEPGLFIWTWISFGLLLLILSKFVFPALLGGVKERERKIAESMDKADEIERRLSKIEKEREEVVSDAKKKADEILRDVRREAGELKDKLAAKAAEDAERILEDARRKIDAERETMVNALRDDLADFVCEASGKLIGSSIAGEKERKMARKLVDEI